MKKRRHFGISILFLVLIIIVCLGIIFLRGKGLEIPSLINKQCIANQEQNMEENVQREESVQKQNVQEYEKNSENLNRVIETQVIQPILGTFNKEETTIQEMGLETRYFYNQLDETAKKIYKVIEAHEEEMKTGNYTIDLGGTFQSVLESNGGEQKLKQAYQDAWDAINTDRVDLFYLDTSKIYLYINTTKIWNIVDYTVEIGPKENENYYAEGFHSKTEVEAVLTQLEEIRKQMMNKTSGGTTYHKITQINDWLVEAISYDETIHRTNTRNIYGALIEKTVVCEGYAKAFQYIMEGMEIPCILVSGTGTNSNGSAEAHLWNYVQLENSWYGVDVTWNDPIIQGNGIITSQIKHRYLCKGKSFLENHKPSGRISQEGKVFNYPNLANVDYR